MSTSSSSQQTSDIPEGATTTEGPPSTEIPRLKRRIAQLEEAADTALGLRQLKKKTTVAAMGRGIRRLSTMFDPLDFLVCEADRRATEGEEGSAEDDPDSELKRNQDRIYQGFIIVVALVPALRNVLNDGDADAQDLNRLISQLQKGGNDGRSEDVRRLKVEVGDWLNTTFSPSVPFCIKTRTGRGIQNDITGALLCPIEYDWNDKQTRADIKAGRLSIKDDVYLSCFYPQGKGDADDIEAKFLRSNLLVKSFCVIFTSPTSADSFEDIESEDGPVRKKNRQSTSQKKATKANVANLLHMNGIVTPRSIAYAAILLAFSLTDAVQWVEVYNGFAYKALWEFIVDYLDAPEDDASKKRVNDLLLWWNKQVFPHHAASSTNSKKSRDKLKMQRALRSNQF
ncbi:hypothetical protein BJ165DRAFT_1399912 [Panaeolus papilionaceus]|nr:hypothetical protein BJ165DRAFT_1399912 [Panaeolus papilionaceus]